MLSHSILNEAVCTFLAAQPGVEVLSVGQKTSGTDLLVLQPDIILIEDGASVDSRLLEHLFLALT